jgi:threonylcarbamoyladenosine tRNA methylthiotransferase MtaB
VKYSVVTFGCRVNQADSLGFEEELASGGGLATDVASADVVIVNTCSVTANADQAARQAIRRVNRLNPAARVIVTGCYATRRPDEVGTLPGVVRVVANDDKPQLIRLLANDVGAPLLTTAERFAGGDGSCGAALQPGLAGRTAFTLRVQTGCAERCSYCIIPTTRGVPRSRSIDEVMAESHRVAAAGFKEIAITGVHLGSYGRDLSPSSALIDLLHALVAVPDVLFRISSLEPMDCTPDVVQLVATNESFAPHFHLPLQHASDRMLAVMQRPYSAAYFDRLVCDIRARMPHASIGSDVIVGFPGETDADFATVAAYLESSPLTHLHVFPYSDRPGTVAASLDDKVPGGVVRERATALRQISERLVRRFRASQIGSQHRALTIDDGETAVTGNYLKVRIPRGRLRNEWVQIAIERDEAGSLRGSVTGA